MSIEPANQAVKAFLLKWEAFVLCHSKLKRGDVEEFFVLNVRAGFFRQRWGKPSAEVRCALAPSVSVGCAAFRKLRAEGVAA